MSRRVFLGIGVLLSPLVAGCSAGTNASADGSVIQIGSTKAALLGLPAEYRALHPRLENLFGMPVRFVAQPDGPALGQQLEMGNIQFAFMSCDEFVAIGDASKLRPIATALNAAGRPDRKAYLVAKAGTSIKLPEDFKGKRFAFGTRGDLLTDIAAQRALENCGVPVNELLREVLTPPPFAIDGRLYLKQDVAKTILADLLLNAGVIDELTLAAMPESGGNFITGPSRDQFLVLEETRAIPEMVVVAGPSADAALTARFMDFLLNQAKDDEKVREQLGVSGFVAARPEAYDEVRQWLSAVAEAP